MRKELQYRTFEELLNEVALDFRLYDNENLIDPAQLIKVANRVNYDLGLKIHKTKGLFLEINNGVGKLPQDLYRVNIAMVCGKYKVIYELPRGDHREDVILKDCKVCGQSDETCTCEKTYTVCEQTHVKVIERCRDRVMREYEEFGPIYMKPSRYITDACYQPKEGRSCMYQAEIRDGYIYLTGIKDCKVFLYYEGNMEDEDGNLLVLDHPMINEYYEYALKQRILEGLYMSGEDVIQKLQFIEEKLRISRKNAKTIINTPDFRSMYEVWKNNRNLQYNRYYNYFRYNLYGY